MGAPIQESDPMRPALYLLCLTLSLACAWAAPAPLPKPNAKQSPLTAERVRVLLAEEQFWDIESIKQRGQATWEVVGRRGIPWCEPAWTWRTFLVSEDGGREGRHLRIVEVAANDVHR
jgi:hypothetical protein